MIDATIVILRFIERGNAVELTGWGFFFFFFFLMFLCALMHVGNGKRQT